MIGIYYLKKKIEAPFIPPVNKDNFDKRYCEGEDNVGEETVERYDLYLQSDLYDEVIYLADGTSDR